MMWMTGIVLAVAGAAAEPPDFEDCKLRIPDRAQSVSAECFTVEVPENWDEPDGRRIELRAARVPATAGEADGNPLLMIAGGPGQSAVDSFVPHVRALQPVRQDHPIILVDQRGTGGSNALHCPEDGLSEDLSAEEVGAAARECLASLDADPRQYTTSVAIRDLEHVRARLALDQWHVYGVSYGTRVGLEYLRRHPQRIETLTLDGVVPADRILGPMIAPFAQRAIDRMLARCAGTEACAEAFPDLATSFDRLMSDLEARPRTVELRHPRHHEPTEVRLTRERVAQVTRFATYQPQVLSIIPLLVHRAVVEGDWAPLAAQWLVLGESMQESIATGMHHSVVCSEDVPFLGEDDAVSRGEGSESFLGDDLVQMLEAACREWPTADIPSDFNEAVVSDRPVLLLSGELDPVTPPAWGDRAAATLSNSRHVILEGKGHNVVHVGCMPYVLRDFLGGTTPAELDTECLDRTRPTPFFLDFSGPSA